MKYTAVFLLVLFSLFAGCSKNNPTEPSVLSDTQLKSKIVGTWQNQFLTTVFNQDGSFQETVHVVAQNPEYNQSELINGTYDIKDGILYFNISDWKILDTTAYPNGSFSSFPEFKLQLTDNQLSFYPLHVCSRLSGDGDNIWGEWISSYWSVSYYPGRISPPIVDKRQTIYKFVKDSLLVYYGFSKYGEPTDSMNFTSAKINYNPPNLSWDTNYNESVEFHNNQMYMFQKLSIDPYPMTKIK